MNSGYIIGIIRNGGRPIEGALIGLDWVRGGGQHLNIYSADADSPADRLGSVRRGLTTDMPSPLVNLNAQTDANGVFCLAFQWSGTDLGTAMDHPVCQIFVLVEERGSDRITMRLRGRYQASMIRAVSLSQVSSGLIPNPSQGTDLIGMGVDFHTVVRGIRRPMIGLTVVRPSADFYSLLAGYRITL